MYHVMDYDIMDYRMPTICCDWFTSLLTHVNTAETHRHMTGGWQQDRSTRDRVTS